MSRRPFVRAGSGWLIVTSVAIGVGWFFAQPEVRRREIRHLATSLAERGARVELTEVLSDLWTLYVVAAEAPVARDVVVGPERLVVAGEPRPDGFLHGPVQLLRNPGYLIGYSDALRSPVWAAYRAGGAERQRPGPRPERFAVDSRTMARVQPADYARSGYDRGHLAPNLALALWHGAEAQRQSFLMSNVVPQRPTLNAGAWRRMEERMARNYPARFEEVWIICGPVHTAPPARLRPGGVAIPDSFFLIVLDETDGRWRAQAFLVPQETDGTESWEHFLTTIDAIERRVGFDFLAALPDAIEGPLEAAVAGRPW